MKKNPIAKKLLTSRYRQRLVKPKKGKGSFKRKKIKF
ncbi:alternative ribosome rescue factor ArfA [Candidatus Pelagibacter sp.]|nr:alternative ribosome rescue factor ArfA [Candidatus Pelagibacter sp.]